MLEVMPDRRRLMLLLATWTTLRFGEITELRRKDMDMDMDIKNNVIKVQRGVTKVSNKELTDPTARTNCPTTPSGAGAVAAASSGRPRQMQVYATYRSRLMYFPTSRPIYATMQLRARMRSSSRITTKHI